MLSTFGGGFKVHIMGCSWWARSRWVLKWKARQGAVLTWSCFPWAGSRRGAVIQKQGRFAIFAHAYFPFDLTTCCLWPSILILRKIWLRSILCLISLSTSWPDFDLLVCLYSSDWSIAVRYVFGQLCGLGDLAMLLQWPAFPICLSFSFLLVLLTAIFARIHRMLNRLVYEPC